MANHSFSKSTNISFVSLVSSYKFSIFIILLLSFFSALSAVAITFLLGKSIDLIIGKNNVLFQELNRTLFFLLVLIIVFGLSQWITATFSNFIAYDSVKKLRISIFDHLSTLPLKFYDQNHYGKVVSHFVNDLDQVSTAVALVLTQLFTGVLTILVTLMVMFRFDSYLTILVVFFTFLIAILNSLIARFSQKYFSSQQEIVGNLSSFTSETIENYALIKSFQQEQSRQDRFEAINQSLNFIGQKAQFFSSLSNPIARFIDHLTYISIGLVGGFLFLAGREHITVGTILSFLIYSAQFSKPFIEFSSILTQIQTGTASLKRTHYFLSQPSEALEIGLPDFIYKKGEIQLIDVSFSYQKNSPILQGFNLSILPNQTVAIVGKTGTGKSTLINLLMRFYASDHGKILIDDQDINCVTKKSLRQSIGLVQQETWLTEGTIFENISYACPNLSKSFIIQTLQEKPAFDFIFMLPNGLDTQIGANSLALSEGQKQLISIARVLLQDPPILILDEATSSLDTKTEQHVQTLLTELFKQKTVIIIAHRLTTIESADKIVVINQGHVIEEGTHVQLLQKKDSLYTKLYNAQFL